VLTAYDITTDNGIPFLSLKICLFAWPSLLLSVGLLPSVIAPIKGDFIDILSYDYHHIHLLPYL